MSTHAALTDRTARFRCPRSELTLLVLTKDLTEYAGSTLHTRAYGAKSVLGYHTR